MGHQGESFNDERTLSEQTKLMFPAVVVVERIFGKATVSGASPFQTTLDIDSNPETSSSLECDPKIRELSLLWNKFVEALGEKGANEIKGTEELNPNGFDRLKMLFAIEYLMANGTDVFGKFFYLMRNYFTEVGTRGADYKIMVDFISGLVDENNDRVSFGLAMLLLEVTGDSQVTLPVGETEVDSLSVKRNGTETTMDLLQVLRSMQEVGVLYLTEKDDETKIEFDEKAQWIKIALERLLKDPNDRAVTENPGEIPGVQALG